MESIEQALAVRRSSGLYRGWTLGEILRHARWHEGLDILALLAAGKLRAGEPERDAAHTITSRLAEVPILDAATHSSEQARLDKEPL